MIHSMTGFAVQTRDLGSVCLHLELRSVNSRYLDLGFRIVDDLRAAEPAIRERLSARLGRGKVECRLNLQAGHGGARSLALNTALLDQLADRGALLRRPDLQLQVQVAPDVRRQPNVAFRHQARFLARWCCFGACCTLAPCRSGWSARSAFREGLNCCGGQGRLLEGGDLGHVFTCLCTYLSMRWISAIRKRSSIRAF